MPLSVPSLYTRDFATSVHRAVSELSDVGVRVYVSQAGVGLHPRDDWFGELTPTQQKVARRHSKTLSGLGSSRQDPVSLYNWMGFDVELLIGSARELLLSLIDRRGSGTGLPLPQSLARSLVEVKLTTRGIEFVEVPPRVVDARTP